ncbi:MAG: glycoside hydrolase family 31 protein [Oscillochloris sp.]|nr:glycoside hydrolase family 31 protein [Oscillochloris sp.]
MIIDRLLEMVQQAQFMGPGGSVRAMQYAVQNRWGYLRRRPRRPEKQFTAIGPVVESTALPDGRQVRFAAAEVELRMLAPDLVRITWQPGRLPVPYGLAQTNWPPVEVVQREHGSGWELSSGEMRVILGHDGRLRMHNRDGQLLRDDCPPLRRGSLWRQTSLLRAEEQIYGLGEQTGPLNLRGRRHRLWNTDPIKSYGPEQDPLYLNIPVYLGVHDAGSYLIFYENSFPARLTFAEDAELEFENGALRAYLIPGPPDRALARYSELTGRPPLPPRWALGFHQSRFSYDNEDDVRGVAAGFTAYDLPLSAIHLDIHYMEGFRVFTVDQQRFHNLRQLAHDLEQRGIRLVTILDPGIKRDHDYRLYREGLAGGHFCRDEAGNVAVGPVWPGWCAFPDFTNPATRQWWGAQYPQLSQQGIAGFWHDMNEPAIAGTWGQHTLAGEIRHDLEGRGGDHHEAHNLYGLQMARAGYEALREQQPERRPFILTRSGWAGIQRYAWTWTGDVQSSWAMLRQTIPTVLNLGLAGMPYSGPDVGGFKGAPSGELFLRWLQLAALLPFFRVHSTIGVPRREPWAFGPELRTQIAAVLHLRSRLMPYLYTLAWQSSLSGHPLARPLFWPDNPDPALRGIDDAFLLGDALLVAPIVEEDARGRDLQLPAGRWYNFWADQLLEGPGRAQIASALADIPILVRAGSILPLEEAGRLALHLYPAADGTAAGQCYGDAGDGYGPWRVDRFALHNNDDVLHLDWEVEGEYPFPYAAVTIHLHGSARKVQVHGAPPGPAILRPYSNMPDA